MKGSKTDNSVSRFPRNISKLHSIPLLNIPSAPVGPNASSMLGVRRNGTTSGRGRFNPLSKILPGKVGGAQTQYYINLKIKTDAADGKDRHEQTTLKICFTIIDTQPYNIYIYIYIYTRENMRNLPVKIYMNDSSGCGLYQYILRMTIPKTNHMPDCRPRCSGKSEFFPCFIPIRCRTKMLNEPPGQNRWMLLEAQQVV